MIEQHHQLTIAVAVWLMCCACAVHIVAVVMVCAKKKRHHKHNDTSVSAAGEKCKKHQKWVNTPAVDMHQAQIQGVCVCARAHAMIDSLTCADDGLPTPVVDGAPPKFVESNNPLYDSMANVDNNIYTTRTSAQRRRKSTLCSCAGESSAIKVGSIAAE